MSPQSPKHNAANGHAHISEIADETTPLIATDNAGPTTQSNAEVVLAKEPLVNETLVNQQGDDDDEDMPLPMGQVIVLCYARMVEPIAVSTSHRQLRATRSLPGQFGLPDIVDGIPDTLSSSPYFPSSKIWCITPAQYQKQT